MNFSILILFDAMDVTYLRYQDDILILCKTQRQLNRCKQRMMAVLKERHLSLSRKKTRIGRIDRGFHFLGIQYPGTQTLDNTNVTSAHEKSVINVNHEYYLPLLSAGGANHTTDNQTLTQERIVPHPRTLRKAREQIKQLVMDGTSSQRIKSYLHRWVTWWVKTSDDWQYMELLEWFLNVCWDINPAAYAAGLLTNAINNRASQDHMLAAVDSHAIA